LKIYSKKREKMDNQGYPYITKSVEDTALSYIMFSNTAVNS
jgi:hypothetical protein